MSKKPLLMISAGEASGDMHAAHMLHALKKRGIEFDAFGMGADKLASEGMELTLDCRDLAVIGIVDVLINYPRFLKRIKKLRAALVARKPDLLVIVDYPDFNLKLAETAKSLGIPVLFYISPQIWAWRKKRITRIGNLVSHMAVLFPFEVDVYEQAGIPVTYVGHPLVDDAVCPLEQTAAKDKLKLNRDQPVVALLPGSRNGELARNLPVMLDTAQRIKASTDGCQFVIPVAQTLSRQAVADHVARHNLPCTIIEGDSYTAMRAADAVLSASGTATLETAMIGTPMAIMYVINPINYAIMSRLIQIEHIGLVNIVAGKGIVKEFIQHEAQADAMAIEIQTLLNDDAYHQAMRQSLDKVRNRMGDGGASIRVAELVEQQLSSTLN